MFSSNDISDFIKSGRDTNPLKKAIDALPSTKSEVKRQNFLPHSEFLATVLKSQKAIKKRKSMKISFSEPIITRGQDKIIFPKTINIIQGKAGTHKSRVAETACSALLKTSGCENKHLGFTASNPGTYSVCYVDTERNLHDQLPYALQRIQTQAGYKIEDHPENFTYISLLEVPRDARFETLEAYLEHMRQSYDNHVFIVLDVTTDCVKDFNRSEDSLKLIDHLNQTINAYDVTFLCLIHENPGSASKARGHLGTELTNKASTVLQVAFETDKGGNNLDLIKIKFLKSRNTRRPDPIYAEYCDRKKGLIEARGELITMVENARKQKAQPSDVAEFLEQQIQDWPVTRESIMQLLLKEFSCSEKTIRERLKSIEDSETYVIHNKEGKACYLESYTAERKLTYRLNPVQK